VRKVATVIHLDFHNVLQCMCPSGTRFNASSSVCDDVDECTERAGDVCKNGKCVNNFGSFTCDCPPNTILDDGGQVCLGKYREIFVAYSALPFQRLAH
jgi:hypothetical protein